MHTDRYRILAVINHSTQRETEFFFNWSNLAETCQFVTHLPLNLCKWIKQVHISEARVTTALDKLAYMEELVNDRLLLDRSTAEIAQTSSSPSTSANSPVTEKRRQPRKSLNISGPVQSYHPHLKNFWYPVTFSRDLKDDTMVCAYVSNCLSLFWKNIYHILTILV